MESRLKPKLRECIRMNKMATQYHRPGSVKGLLKKEAGVNNTTRMCPLRGQHTTITTFPCETPVRGALLQVQT